MWLVVWRIDWLVVLHHLDLVFHDAIDDELFGFEGNRGWTELFRDVLHCNSLPILRQFLLEDRLDIFPVISVEEVGFIAEKVMRILIILILVVVKGEFL